MQHTVQPENIFNGPLKGWGLVQGINRQVKERFEFTMRGTWNADKTQCTLEEDFTYASGKKDSRVWHIEKNAQKNANKSKAPLHHYTATAESLVGQARGTYNPATDQLHWNYTLKLNINGRPMPFKFSDYMWSIPSTGHEGVSNPNQHNVVNRAYIKKLGITVAQLSIFIQKNIS